MNWPVPFSSFPFCLPPDFPSWKFFSFDFLSGLLLSSLSGPWPCGAGLGSWSPTVPWLAWRGNAPFFGFKLGELDLHTGPPSIRPPLGPVCSCAWELAGQMGCPRTQPSLSAALQIPLKPASWLQLIEQHGVGTLLDSPWACPVKQDELPVEFAELDEVVTIASDHFCTKCPTCEKLLNGF